MTGNVAECCYDWYNSDVVAGDNGNATVTNPKGSPSGTNHVNRGGYWSTDANWNLIGIRISNNSGGGAYWRGFRLVRNAW